MVRMVGARRGFVKRSPAMHTAKTSRPISCLLTGLGFMAACGTQNADTAETQTSDPITEAPAKGDGDGDATTTAGDADRGKDLADELVCGSCHTENFAGTGYYANITQDEDTGIGAWSDDEIAQAIVHGTDDEGDSLCAAMPRSKLSKSELADMVAYLRTIPAVKNEITKVCPGHGK